ncbi:MAG: hypothetical protein JRN68_04175, partial [Nitrososphaerota archaeon]|nr:hypothetical protein [Nitrososphaerota archaeon]
HKSPGVALALNPYIGYQKAAEVVKRALAEEKTIKEVVLEMGLLAPETVEKIFDPHSLTQMGIAGKNQSRLPKRNLKTPAKQVSR